MARVDVFRTAKDGTFLFYNVEAAVGMGGANRKDDVLLVQYLLKIVAAGGNLVVEWKNFPGGRSGNTTMQSPSTPDPGLTGVWNDWDVARLKGVELFAIKKGVSTWQDGRVDPVPFGRTHGPAHHTQYKIITLNLMYAKLRASDFPRMSQAGDCPAELRPLIGAPEWLSG